jgi:type III secretion protein X
MDVNSLVFDRGIDTITYTSNEAARQSLPERQSLVPPAEGIKARLLELLAPPNTTTYLQEQLRPILDNQNLLLPTHYSETLSAALESLSTAAERDTDNSRVLNRAVRVLKEEVNLRELLQMYRSVLYQG